MKKKDKSEWKKRGRERVERRAEKTSVLGGKIERCWWKNRWKPEKKNRLKSPRKENHNKIGPLQ